MKRCRELYDRFWFRPAPAARLAVVRVLVGLFVLQYLGQRIEMLTGLGYTEAPLFEPAGVAAILSKPISPEMWQLVLWSTLALNLTFISGWKFRLTGPLFAALLLALLSYRNSWSMIYHNDDVLVLHVLILGLLPSADTWSLDAFFRQRRQAIAVKRSAAATFPEGDDAWIYGWGLQLLCVVVVVTYFLAGVAKVAGPLGWTWFNGEALRSQLAADSLRKELLGYGASPLVFALYHHVWLFTFLGAGSLALELGAPLALSHRRAGQLWCLSVLAMHWGIYLTMGISFTYYLYGIIYAPFFAVELLVEWCNPRVREVAESVPRLGRSQIIVQPSVPQV